MFTGLVADLGTVAAVDTTGDGVRLTVHSPLADDVRDGESVAVNGVCLTAVDAAPGRFCADVMHETLDRSTLGGACAGDRINLELALRAADRLGGHIVQGHVDGVGTVSAVREDGMARVVTVDAPSDVLRYVVFKGSVAIDGVSLTVSRVDSDGLDVSLIPETLARTTLGAAAPGMSVNLEVDVLAKYVEKLAVHLGAGA